MSVDVKYRTEATATGGGRSEGGFGLAVTLKVKMPGVDRAIAEKIAERGHFICPYSHATKGNISVTTEIV